MNGVTVESQISLRDACAADAVIVGSGVSTRESVKDASLMAELQLDPSRQLLGAPCSGTLILAKSGLLGVADADAARSALHYGAPVGEKEGYVERAMRAIEPYLMSGHAMV